MRAALRISSLKSNGSSYLEKFETGALLLSWFSTRSLIKLLSVRVFSLRNAEIMAVKVIRTSYLFDSTHSCSIYKVYSFPMRALTARKIPFHSRWSLSCQIFQSPATPLPRQTQLPDRHSSSLVSYTEDYLFRNTHLMNTSAY